MIMLVFVISLILSISLSKKGSLDWSWIFAGSILYLSLYRFFYSEASIISIPLAILILIFSLIQWSPEAYVTSFGVMTGAIVRPIELCMIESFSWRLSENWDLYYYFLFIATFIVSYIHTRIYKGKSKLEFTLEKPIYESLSSLSDYDIEVAGYVTGNDEVVVSKRGDRSSVGFPIRELSGKYIRFIFHTHPRSVDIPSKQDLAFAFIPSAVITSNNGIPYITFYYNIPFILKDCRILNSQISSYEGGEFYSIRRPLVYPCISPFFIGRLEGKIIRAITYIRRL